MLGVHVLIKYETCEIFDSYLLDSFFFFFWISGVGICKFLRSSMLLVCMAPLIPAVTMRGLTFQPCVLLAFINKLYLFYCLYGLVKESITCKCDDLDG